MGLKRSGDPPLKIRPVKRAELEVLVEMIHELASFERMADQVKVRAEDLAKLLFHSKPKLWALMAWNELKAVGYAIVSEHFSSFAGSFGLYLEDLYVRKEYRGTGAGRSLVGHVGLLAALLGYDRLDFQVLDWNVQAKAFYEKLGACAFKEWVPYRLSGKALRALAEDTSQAGA